MDFPNRLKKLRKLHGMTQEQLGRKINVTKVSVSGYESGNRSPDLETLQKIADVFDVSIDYLLGKTDDPKGEQNVIMNKNIREVLESEELHYDGVPLSEEQMRVFRDLLEVVVKERLPKYLEEQKKREEEK